jgi:HK97 family phage major capsid protein
MAENIKALLEQRGKLIADARALLDRESKGDELGAEDLAKYDELTERAQKIGDQIGRIERQRQLESEAEAAADAAERSAGNGRENGEPGDRMAAFRSWMANGRAGLSGAEERSLSSQVATEGGYTVAPEQFVTNLIKFVDDQVFIRQLATTYQLPRAMSLGAPELTADPADFDWTTELQTGSEDSAMAFGKRALYPHPLAKRLKVSKTLMRQSVLPIETLIAQRLGYKLGVTQEKAFLTGTGDNQPLGLFTTSANGISAARDVSTGNTTTAIGVDGLINAKFSLKGQYQARASWLFHRDAVKGISKLKDGQGQYLWQPSMQAGTPDMLLGRPVMMSEFAPNTFTTGLHVGMIADFSHYWIVDALSMQMQRLEELYAESNQVGFIARLETDGAPVLAEAFARVTLA